MKVLAFIVAATIFEAVGDAVMRIALHYHVMPGRILLFASAIVLLAMYGAFLNLAPIEFASATGIYLASLFIAFQIVNYLFFRHTPGPGVLLGGAFILTGSAISTFGDRTYGRVAHPLLVKYVYALVRTAGEGYIRSSIPFALLSHFRDRNERVWFGRQVS